MKILVLLLLAHIDIALALSSSSSSSSSCSSSSITTTATVTTSSTLGGSSVHVYNNVLPTESCNVLHHAASLVGLEHKVFQRGSPSSDLIIEQALESLLNELEEEEKGGDGSKEQQQQQQQQKQQQQQYVEYWTRQEWRHIEAHADVDENLAKQHDLDLGMIIDDDKTTYFRYPDFGHVLYLKIGSKVRGPTCVFPNIKSGGELLSTKQENNNNNKVDLITVPAVNGRLLKFVGNALHAVPRPADIWFLSFVKGSAQYTPEDEYGRSVILFNTWSNEPPKDVPISSSISISSSSSSSCASVSTTSDDDDDGNNNNNEEEEEGSSTSTTTKVDVDVNPHDTWENVFDFIHDDDDDQEKENEEEEGNTDGDGDNDDSTTTMSKVKIWLLGNERRRQYPMRTVNMYAPQNKEKIKEVFQESKQVHHVQLERGS